MEGIILVDKTAGWTSFDVVAKVRNLLRTEMGNRKLVMGKEKISSDPFPISHFPLPKLKVGHSGTLDPFATGLMIVLVGSYCKRAEEFTKLDKTYEVEATLGQTSTTGDPEGELTKISGQRPTKAEIETVLNTFIGPISQVPPVYSAIKVGGQRAYKLARQGKQVIIEPRKVAIHSLEFSSYDYPNLNFLTSVSSGTYIRSLVGDIGNTLGTGAYTSALRRTTVGNYNIQDAIAVEKETTATEVSIAIQGVI